MSTRGNCASPPTSKLKSDILIVGAGMAGASAAVSLGKAGFDVILVDPHDEYPKDFRCEKFDGSQLELIEKLSLAEIMFPGTTPNSEIYISRFGKLLNREKHEQYSFSYETVVNSLRAHAKKITRFIKSKVRTIEPGDELQQITLSNGQTVLARLVILSSGLNLTLINQLGLERKIISKKHCLATGFNIHPTERSVDDIDCLTYWPEQSSEKMAYMSMFKTDTLLRANMFGYWDLKDATIKSLQSSPKQTLLKLMPNLRSMIGEFEIEGKVTVRPIDLYTTDTTGLKGTILIGDSFSTSCPGAGTGCDKVFTDVLQLCDAHIPTWFKTPGMSATKISSFYGDPIKQDMENFSRQQAFFLRAITLDKGIEWKTRRLLRFGYHLARGFAHGYPFTNPAGWDDTTEQ